MATRCATLAEVLDQVRDCRTFGDVSEGTVTFATNPADGTVFTVTQDEWTFPEVSATLAAKTGGGAGVGEYDVGGDTSATAVNFAAKVNSSAEEINAFVRATVSGAVVTLATVAEGPVSRLRMETDEPAALVLSGARLEGGSDMVEHARSVACTMIDLGCFGNKSDIAHIYLTGHLCAVANDKERGPVTSKSIDKLAIAYAAVGVSEDMDFNSTRWGRLYLMLRSSLLMMPIVGRRTLLVPGR